MTIRQKLKTPPHPLRFHKEGAVVKAIHRRYRVWLTAGGDKTLEAGVLVARNHCWGVVVASAKSIPTHDKPLKVIQLFAVNGRVGGY